MKSKGLYLLLLAIFAVCAVAAQSDDIPIENDNQFPPDDHLEEPESDDVLEGSGKGTTEPDGAFEFDTTTEYPLEEIEAVIDEETTTLGADDSCPSSCLCSIEGEDFVTDCSRLGLKEFPALLNPDTTILKVQNNELTDIPKDISNLKKLRILNAENNSIMEVIPGTISELPELTVLKLANNRLLDIPLDLKNSFQLSKLEELDLGGNDIRAELSPDLFTKFESLKTLTLPTSNDNLLQDICAKLKYLDTICTGSCDAQSYECINVPHTAADDELDATVPGMLSVFQEDSDKDPSMDILDSSLEQNEARPGFDNGEDFSINPSNIEPTKAVIPEVVSSDVAQSSRSAFKKEAEENIPKKLSDILETPKDSNKTEPDVKVGATTSEAAPGAVNRSVIGFVVAAMVVIVAGITIGKNWGSIRKRFQSNNSRTPERRANANGNGTSPDEVPLKEKDKSPV